MVQLDAANRDARVFDRPGELDLTRRPNPHLAFGFGPHYCVAAQLAKAELRVAVGSLLRRSRTCGSRSPTESCPGAAAGWCAAWSSSPSRGDRRPSAGGLGLIGR